MTDTPAYSNPTTLKAWIRKAEKDPSYAKPSQVATWRATLAQVEAGKTDNPNLVAALALASRGWSVFPCREKPGKPYKKNGKEITPQEKEPYTSGGVYDGTNDVDKIRQFWKKYPDALIGVSCGASRLVLVDLDNKDGRNGIEAWNRLGIIDAGAFRSETPSGGKHLIFSSNGSENIHNSNNGLAKGIDIKSSGGYFIAPPSKIVEGKHPGEYRMIGDWTDKPAAIPPALALILGRMETKPANPPSNNGSKPTGTIADKNEVERARQALKRLASWRCDNYEGDAWINVGMALSELGDDGLALWDEWSKGSGEYEPGKCAEKWPSFKPGDGLHLGSLHYWAECDSPFEESGSGQMDNMPEPPPAFEYDGPAEELPDMQEATQPAPAQISHKRWTVAELLDTEFPAPRWAIPDRIPVGLSNLGGRPKVGKSWMGLQIAHAKGTGGMFLNQRVDKGNVLYLALEDSPRRLKDRIQKQGIPRDACITFETEWKKLNNGGLTDLEIEIARGEFSLIIIDTLSRAVGRADQMDMAEMTAIMGGLQSMAIHNNIAILIIDHHRKKGGLDESNPIDDILGSTGKSAVIDAALGLYREQGKHGATLKIIGREIEEQDLALEWDGLLCCWQSLGDAHEVRADTLKADILRAIRELCDMGEQPTTTRIATHISGNKGNVSRALAELVTSGKVRRGDKDGRERPYLLIEDIQQ